MNEEMAPQGGQGQGLEMIQQIGEIVAQNNQMLQEIGQMIAQAMGAEQQEAAGAGMGEEEALRQEAMARLAQQG